MSVLPALNNVYERLLAAQLLSHFRDLLSDFLSAYRKNYSCETTLLRLVEDWKESLDRGELVAMVAMDLSKAFDSLLHGLLIAKLTTYGLDDHAALLLRDYLTGRRQRVKIGDTMSSWEGVNRGVPQGSAGARSPIL